MTDARLLATNPENSSLVPVACNAQGQLLVNDVQIEEIPNDVRVSGDLEVRGQARAFNFRVDQSSGTQAGGLGTGEWFSNSGADNNDVVLGLSNSDFYIHNAVSKEDIAIFKNNGNFQLNGNKAGFTSDGHLYCTTIRGDRVILENTSGGFGAWIAYDAAYLKAQAKAKLEDWSEKDDSAES